MAKTFFSKEEGVKIIASNRKARYLYFIDELFEAGIVLLGTEVKSAKLGHVSMADSYAAVKKGEVFLFNMNITPYDKGGYVNHEPRRVRKLLLNKKEIRKLFIKTEERGMTLVPITVYVKNGKIKIELALAHGKRSFDKRDAITKRDQERDMDRSVKYR